MNTPYRSSSIWENPEPESPSTPAPLTRAAVVRAAISMADRDGLDGVSMRKVAAGLDVGPMRLYRYVRTKDDLLELMVDSAYGEIAAALGGGPGEDWRAAVHRLARAFRETAFRHEWFVDLLGGRPHIGPHALTVLETTAAAVSSAGATDADTVWSALGVINAYLIGAVRADVVERRAARASGRDEAGWQADVAPYLQRMFASGSYPTLGRMIVEVTQPDPDEDFAWGVDAVLDGIATS